MKQLRSLKNKEVNREEVTQEVKECSKANAQKLSSESLA